MDVLTVVSTTRRYENNHLITWEGDTVAIWRRLNKGDQTNIEGNNSDMEQ